jgi:hypothetical protein
MCLAKGHLKLSHAIEFIETPTFTRQIQAIATDDELKELQRTLIAQPDKGDLIQGTVDFERSAWRWAIRVRAAALGLFTS